MEPNNIIKADLLFKKSEKAKNIQKLFMEINLR